MVTQYIKNKEAYYENLDIRKSEKEKSLRGKSPSACPGQSPACYLPDHRGHFSRCLPGSSHGNTVFRSMHRRNSSSDLGRSGNRETFSAGCPRLLPGPERRYLCLRCTEIFRLPKRDPRICLHGFQDTESPGQHAVTGRRSGKISLSGKITSGSGAPDPFSRKDQRKPEDILHDLPCGTAWEPSEPADLCFFKRL